MFEIVVITATFNRLKILKKFIKRLGVQTPKFEFHLVYDGPCPQKNEYLGLLKNNKNYFFHELTENHNNYGATPRYEVIKKLMKVKDPQNTYIVCWDDDNYFLTFWSRKNYTSQLD